MRSVQSVRWVVAAAVAEALIGLLALRLACLSAMGVLGFVGLIVAAFVVMSWYCGLGLEYQTRATDHEGEEGERQSHRQETDKHKQRLLPLSRRYDAPCIPRSLATAPGSRGAASCRAWRRRAAHGLLPRGRPEQGSSSGSR